MKRAMKLWAFCILAFFAVGHRVTFSADPGHDAPHADKEPPLITVTILGSGSPLPSRTQVGPSILIEAAGEQFIFDCGRGCTTRLAQVDPRLITTVHNLFLTHMHSDHLLGIPDLWLNGWVQLREQPLTVWGPEGTIDMMKNLRAAFERDIGFRVSDGVPTTTDALGTDFHELPIGKDTVVYDKKGVKVTAFVVDHGSIKPAYGYKFEYAGKSVLISGDTTTTPSLYEYGKGVDVVILEVFSPALLNYVKKYFSEKQVKKILSYHLTASQAADIFAKTDPGLGVYYHTRNEPKYAQGLVDATREGYKGPLLVGSDLMQIYIGKDSIESQQLKP